MVDSNESSRKICLIHHCGIQAYPYLINSVKLLTEAGWMVDVFAWSDTPLPNYKFNNERVCEYRFRPPVLSGNIWSRALRFILYIPWILYITAHRQYSALIGFDQNGLFAVSLISMIRQINPVIYYSSELHTLKDNRNLIDRLKKFFEIILSRRVKLVIIQDQRRANILIKENRLDPKRIILVPNGPLSGIPKNNRSNYLKDLLVKNGIQDNKVILLYMGTISDWTRIKEIVKTVENWPSESILFIHGWGNETYMREIKELASRYSPPMVIISSTILEYDRLEELTCSSDIGLALYNNDSVNSYEAASGKLYEYMKAGIPSITSDFPNLKLIIENNKAGICVSNKDFNKDLISAVNYLVKNKDLRKCLGQNARHVFLNKYSYEKGFANVISFLETISLRKIR